MNKSIEVFKKTTSDWYPSYTIGSRWLVRVIITPLIVYPMQWRVAVWGADDFGMEKDFDHYGYAQEMFNHLIALDSIEPEWLKEHGFINA